MAAPRRSLSSLKVFKLKLLTFGGCCCAFVFLDEFLYLFVYSLFIHLFMYIHLFIHSPIHSFMYSSIPYVIYLLLIYLLIYLSLSCTYQSFIYPCLERENREFMSFICLLIFDILFDRFLLYCLLSILLFTYSLFPYLSALFPYSPFYSFIYFRVYQYIQLYSLAMHSFIY